MIIKYFILDVREYYAEYIIAMYYSSNHIQQYMTEYKISESKVVWLKEH